MIVVMIVDSVVLLSISSHIQHADQFVGVLLGNDQKITEVYELNCDPGIFLIVAAEKRDLVRNVSPGITVKGYVFVGRGLDWKAVDVPLGAEYLLFLQLDNDTSSPIFPGEIQSTIFRFNSTHSTWEPDALEITDNIATEISVSEVLGHHDDLDLRRAKMVLLHKIRRLETKLVALDHRAKNPDKSKEESEECRAEIGKIIAQTGQLRKIIPRLISQPSVSDSDSVIYEMMSRLASLPA